MALRGGDLKGFVEDIINIDLYKAKMGSDDGISVLSFEVNDKAPAEDLMNFLEKGYDYILDADLTAGETESGNYMVFVEIETTEMLPNQLKEILADVTRLTEIDNWKFKYYKRDTVHEFSVENIAEIVPTDVESYTAQIDEQTAFDLAEFFNGTDIRKISVKNNDVVLHKQFTKHQFEIHHFGDRRIVTEEMGSPLIRIDESSMNQCVYLSKWLGYNYGITKMDDKFVLSHQDMDLVLTSKEI